MFVHIFVNSDALQSNKINLLGK